LLFGLLKVQDFLLLNNLIVMAIIFMINLIMDRAKDLIGLKNKIEVAKN
jgi:hypothetical protein